MDFLLDSNWLVTLCGITISFYIFVLSVPILIQQAFLPEEVREIYNSRNRQKKGSEIDGLKKIGLCVLVFIFFFANPAWKYLFNKIPERYNRDIWLSFFHVVIFGAFLFVVRDFYLFMRRHFFYSRPHPYTGDLRDSKIKFTGVDRYLKPYSNRIREKVVKLVVADLLENYNKSGSIVKEDIDDLATLSKSFQFSGDKNYILEGVKVIAYEIVNSTNRFYDGSKLSDLIHRVLEEVVLRDPEMCTRSNFLKSKEISSTVMGVYKSRRNLLASYDSEEMITFVVRTSVILMEKGKKNDKMELLIGYLNLLREFPNSSVSSYKLYKKLFAEHVFGPFADEFSMYYYEPAYRDDNTTNNTIAYLAWFFNSDDKFMKEYSDKWIKWIFHDRSLSKNTCIESIDYFFNINEFNTASAIDNMIKDNSFANLLAVDE